MIASLSGVVTEVEPKALVLDVNGVGYRVMVSSALREKLPVGEEVTLKIYHHITDSSQSLFGFASQQELEYFELLLTVPSIGPKTAMGILDAAPPAILTQAVFQKDLLVLTNISGIGKRTAERILVELSGKVAALVGEPTALTVHGKVQQETVEVLISMGIKSAQAKAVVGKLPTDIATVEEAVRAALKQQ